MEDFCDFEGDPLSAAEAFVANLPSPEEQRKQKFMKLVAAAIDYGKSHNIDVDFVNPLEVSMKALSENIITHQTVA